MIVSVVKSAAVGSTRRLVVQAWSHRGCRPGRLTLLVRHRLNIIFSTPSFADLLFFIVASLDNNNNNICNCLCVCVCFFYEVDIGLGEQLV